MAYVAAVEESTRFTLSDQSLWEPKIEDNPRCSASVPFIKPNLSNKQPQNAVKKIKYYGRICYQHIKTAAGKPSEQKVDLTLHESKQLLFDLAAELERVFQYKISLTNRNTANKTTKKEQEEQEYYFLQWAEDVENTQTNTEKSPFEQLSIKKNTRELLFDWSCQLKDKKPNSVIPKSESEKILKDLHRTWKQGQSSILPVMDWMIWTVLHSESSEDSVARQWIKRSRNFASDTFVPKPVWNWITKCSANIILDPNTANPELLVYKNGKRLKAKTNKEGVDNWKEFQRKRSKFDGWTCVQAKEGYITGRHYWEVDVNGKSEWRVGVVKESANRNGYVTMNTKAGFWNLRLQLRTLMVLTTPLTKLNMQAPSKIGVYLDMEESLVSFYDALKRRHIYTFNTDFQEFENIYPMFGTVETDRALIISV